MTATAGPAGPGRSGSTSAPGASASPCSDSAGTLATPAGHLARSGDAERDRRALVDLVVEEEAVVVVVGLRCPSTAPGAGRPGGRGRGRGPGRACWPTTAIGVELFDERLTTVSAHQALTAGGTRGRDQRAVVDQAAAAVMLSAWLDGAGGP